jgi:excisionase family DNA binding protein
MKKQMTQVFNISPEDFKKEIVTDLVTEMKKELQDFSENFTPNYSPEFIDSKEAAKILGVTLPTLFDWRKRKIIVAYRIGNKIRFKKSEIENSLTKIDE